MIDKLWHFGAAALPTRNINTKL